MSQRLKSGFSWPRFPVGASNEDCVIPATLGNWSRRFLTLPSGLVPVVACFGESFQSRALAVGHPETGVNINTPLFPLLCISAIALESMTPMDVAPELIAIGAWFPNRSCVDSPPVKPLADVRCADARSAQIGDDDGIAQCFQVSSYSGEPRPSSLARNLLSNDD
jgi:hypothetical protein